jgi:hypothetical protein
MLHIALTGFFSDDEQGFCVLLHPTSRPIRSLLILLPNSDLAFSFAGALRGNQSSHLTQNQLWVSTTSPCTGSPKGAHSPAALLPLDGVRRRWLPRHGRPRVAEPAPSRATKASPHIVLLVIGRSATVAAIASGGRS